MEALHIVFLEHFHCFSTEVAQLCCHHNLDTEIPKLYSVGNNMDPLPELCVTYINVKLSRYYNVIKLRSTNLRLALRLALTWFSICLV